MKKLLTALLFTVLLASCTTQQPLYSWGNYDKVSYNYLKNQDEESTAALIKSYQNIIANKGGSRGTVPPGLYADYGFILITANRIEEGKAMLQKEVELYPEAKPFIDNFFKMLGQ
jgi:hypothetical protein